MTEHQPEAPLPSAAAVRAYLDASAWTRHPGPSWSRDGHHVEVPVDATPDELAEIEAAIAQAEGRAVGDVAVSVEALAWASTPAKECGCSQLQPCGPHMAGPPVMPQDESDLLKRVRQAIDEVVAEAVSAERERAERAEAKLAEVRVLCRDIGAAAPESARVPIVAVQRILAIIGTGEEARDG